MKVCDLVRFSEESYFNGAVQTEWYYDKEKARKIATSYVFHGPKYFGVSASDVSANNHKLIDTASFAKRITEKIYSPDSSQGNNFIMTIAGYGTGKSHLAVCLAELFSGDMSIVGEISSNIAEADAEIGEYVRNVNTKKNLVIVLNGMNNFNLDAEILKCAKISLNENGIDETILHSLTKSYDVARHFVDRNYDTYSSSFEKSALLHNSNYTGAILKQYLLDNLENNTTLEIINDVYAEVTGDLIHWDRGISSGDVLKLLAQELCGNDKPFHKIIVFFDEFGRYIEYAAANPTVAGEASLQQIFEAVQGANGNIIFTGFIQNELSAYLSRIDKTSNIIRYVGRYENSEKLFLSSNFETILANLLKKNESAGFSRIMNNALNRYESFHNKVFESIGRWDRTTNRKSVWEQNYLYKKVILSGCYPLHPITAWILSNASSWMQQRSTIAFVSEMFSNVQNKEIDGVWLPYVYPIDIVDSNIYNEMLNSEEKGLVQSQYCMLYRDITLKIGDKLSDDELKALKAILVMNVGKFATKSKDDALLAIRYCSNLKDDEITKAIKSLEDLHGVIAFDENSMTYDLIAEANGFNEFKRVYSKYRLGTSAEIDDIDSDLLSASNLSGVIETSFAQVHNISSSEWVFEKRLMSSDRITSSYIDNLKRTLEGNISGETPRGYLIFAYCNKGFESEIERLSELYIVKDLKRYAIIILPLDDSENTVIDALRIKNTIAKFSKSDQERFHKHISSQIRAQNSKIATAFPQMIFKKNMISSSGLVNYEGRLNALCSNRFEELYPQAPLFAFDGFQNRVTTQAKKYLSNICIKMFDGTLMNIHSYMALTQDEKNRVKSCLSVGVATSWQVFDSNCMLVEPIDKTILSICDEIDEKLDSGDAKSISQLFNEYTQPPYGMNLNSISLLLFYYIAKKGNSLFCYFGQEKLKANHLSDKVFKSSKLQEIELRKIRLQINQNAAIDPVAELCKKSLKCTYIEECGSLRVQLKQLVEQEGTSTDNQTLVAQANTRLDEGIKILKAISEKNTKAKEIIAESKRAFSISKFYHIFDYITNCDAILSDEYNFKCGDTTRKQVDTIKSEINTLMETKYISTVNRLKCDITQLSAFKSLYKRIADTLVANNYEKYAESTLTKLKSLEEELLVKQKYEAIITEVNKDISVYDDLSAYSYRELGDITTKVNKWITYFESNEEIPESIKAPIQKSLLDILNQISEKRNAYVSVLNDTFETLNSVSDLKNLQLVISKLQRIKTYGYDDENDEKINSAIDSIQSQMAIINNFPDSIDSLISLKNSSQTLFTKAVNNELDNAINRLIEQQDKWYKQVIEIVKNSIDSFSASKCVEWLENNKAIPNYVSSSVKDEYQNVHALVNSRLHKCKIDGVVSMFETLNDDEKKQCLLILNKKGS